jgi:hypothetical protein
MKGRPFQSALLLVGPTDMRVHCRTCLASHDIRSKRDISIDQRKFSKTIFWHHLCKILSTNPEGRRSFGNYVIYRSVRACYQSDLSE